MKILKRHYEKPTIQVYKLREVPKILADSASGSGNLDDYTVPSEPLNW